MTAQSKTNSHSSENDSYEFLHGNPTDQEKKAISYALNHVFGLKDTQGSESPLNLWTHARHEEDFNPRGFRAGKRI